MKPEKSDDELQQQVGQLRGWRVKQIPQQHDNFEVYILTLPNGNKYGRWSTTETGAWSRLPDWINDVNEALTLVSDMDGFSLTAVDEAIWGGKWEASIPDPADDENHWTAYHNQPGWHHMDSTSNNS